MTKREKRLQTVRRAIQRQERNHVIAVKMLVHATLELPKLRKEEARLMTAISKRQRPVDVELARHDETEARSAIAQAALKAVEGLPEEPEDEGIPEFLRRGMAAQKAADSAIEAYVYEAAHAVANAHNKAPTEEQKKLVAKEKRIVRDEHKHAELTGKKRRWPATGKDAVNLLK